MVQPSNDYDKAKKVPKKIPENIDSFIAQCAEVIAEIEEDVFYRDTKDECLEYPNADHEMESPIDLVLYIALNALVKLDSRLKIAVPVETPTGIYGDGLFIQPQKRINNYRIDFLVTFDIPLWRGEEYRKELLVECDSQQFHERTEKERRYEKKRDRELQKEGYKVFRYTGRQILDQPFLVASEILNELVPWARGPESLLFHAIKGPKVEV